MLTKTINVSGALKTRGGMFINVSFNYRNDVKELNIIDFNFNKNEVNVFGSYNIVNNKFSNYSVNNGIIDEGVFEDIKVLLEEIAKDPNNPSFYEPEAIAQA